MLTHIKSGAKIGSIFLNDKKFFLKISGLYARFLKIYTLLYGRILPDICQSRPYGRAVFRIGRDMETHMINAFHLRKHFPALRQLGKITYQHKVLYRTVQGGKHSRTADSLEHGINDAAGNVFR